MALHLRAIEKAVRHVGKRCTLAWLVCLHGQRSMAGGRVCIVRSADASLFRALNGEHCRNCGTERDCVQPGSLGIKRARAAVRCRALAFIFGINVQRT